jgi:LAO/AO transport system kinase
MSGATKAQREACRQPRPDWVPPDAGESFATWILQGATPSGATRAPVESQRRHRLTLEDYACGIRHRDTTILAQAITLIESNAARHQGLAQQLLTKLLPLTGGAMRVGITGIPGAGKSTFIEALGCKLCEKGHRVAVLAVDPSSTITGGSVLADKLRMEKLSRERGAFIRPSPSGGSLGGVARKSREAMLLCEAAGYDVIIVETVGVGQNEVTVRSMVDCFLVLMVGGTGDEFQGLKKGVIELADLIVVNKAEGDNRPRALAACAEMTRVLAYLRPATEGWTTSALMASARSGEGVVDVWRKVEEFFRACRLGGVVEQRRRAQTIAWMHGLIQEALQHDFYQMPAVKARLPAMEKAVAEGKTPPLIAARQLLELAAAHPRVVSA